MAIALTRETTGVDADDAHKVRDLLKQRVVQQVLLKGEPHPSALLVGDGFLEVLDLNAMSKEQPAADPSATLQKLKAERSRAERYFLIFQATGVGEDGQEVWMAVLLEELDDGVNPRRWWMGILPFQRPTDSVVGVPGEWSESNGETDDVFALPEFVRGFVMPRAGAVAADYLPPQSVQPDIQVAAGVLPEGARLPTNCKEMHDFAGSLGAGDLMSGAAQGTLVVRLAGREWELWVLSGPMPTSIEDMVRYVANTRAPAADGVALLQFAVRPKDDPPVVGLQIIAEMKGQHCETWGPLEFPEGVDGPKRIPQTFFRAAAAVPEGGMWLGVDPNVLFKLGPLG